MKKRFIIIALLALLACTAYAATIRIGSGRAGSIIVTPVAAPDPEPPVPGQSDVYGGNGGVFDSNGGVF